VFVSNVLNGVITRIDLSIPRGGDPIVKHMTEIASGYLTRTDPAALVVGPTGLAFDARHNSLYVASTGDNEIFSISNAKDRKSDLGMGRLVYQDSAHLRGPLGLVLAPNGDLITANGDAVNPDPTQTSELVEFTPHGQFVSEFSIDPNAGAAFGLAVTNTGGFTRLAAVEDGTNSLDLWTFRSKGKSTSWGSGVVGMGVSPASHGSTAPTGTSHGPLTWVGPLSSRHRAPHWV
jgi:DNA-binding beta-propeller fold protein YncE